MNLHIFNLNTLYSTQKTKYDFFFISRIFVTIFQFFLIFQVILVVKYVRINVAENITIWKVQKFEAGVTKFAELHVGELQTHSTPTAPK